MADWKLLLSKVLLADGVIDKAESALLKKAILADGVVDDEEVEFLVTLRNGVEQKSPEFDQLFFSALKANLLADGVIDAAETNKLRKILLADGIIDDDEKRFLRGLKRGAKSVAPEFDAFLEKCLK